MNTPEPEKIDGLVRDHLDNVASTVNGSSMQQRVRASVSTSEPNRRTLFKRIGIGAGVGIAAAVYFSLGGPEVIPVKQVSAAEWVEQAKVEHAKLSDRKYKLDVDLQPMVDNPAGFGPSAPPLLREATLWTRGNVFFVESTGQFGRNWIWGRNTEGKIWISSDRKIGTTFDLDETTEPVARTCDMMGVQIPYLLQQLVKDAELTQEETGSTKDPIRVTATFRNGPGLLGARTVTLWIDRETKVISKMIIERTFKDRPITTFTFTLLETATLDESLYTLNAHLDKNGRVLPRESPIRKRLLEDMINRIAPKPPLPQRPRL